LSEIEFFSSEVSSLELSSFLLLPVFLCEDHRSRIMLMYKSEP